VDTGSDRCLGGRPPAVRETQGRREGRRRTERGGVNRCRSPVWGDGNRKRWGRVVDTVGQGIVLSLTGALNPTPVAATTVMLLLPRPTRLMLGYLAGAYLTSITLGLVIVFSLSDSGAANTTENTLSPSVDIALGAIALTVAWVIHSGRQQRFTERRRARKE